MQRYLIYGVLSLMLTVFNSFSTLGASNPLVCVNDFNIFSQDELANILFEDKGLLPYGSGLQKIVIDAGHGGRDGGATGRLFNEKDLTLKIAKKLGKAINKTFPDIEVIYTRTEDVFIPLSERAAIANEAKADLFISIHCNAMPNTPAGKKIHGSETYVLGASKNETNLAVAKRENEAIFLEEAHDHYQTIDPDSPEWHIFMSMYQQTYLTRSASFAEKVEKQMYKKAKRKSRGVLQNNFHVLREVAMPSVLIETGYLTNMADENFVGSKKGQDIIVQSIIDALIEYKMEIEGKITNSPSVAVAQATENGHHADNGINEPSEDKPKPLIRRANKSTDSTNKANSPVAQPVSMTEPKEEKVVLSKESLIKQDEKKDDPIKKKETPVAKESLPASSDKKPAAPKPPEKKIKKPKAKIVPIDYMELAPIFKIQLAASKNPINTNAGNWRNIAGVEVVQEGGYFKYLTGHTKHWPDIKSIFKIVRENGFKDAFIVAYFQKKRIGLEEAKKMLQ